MFAPAGQTTARAGQLCWLAALVVRRQAPGPGVSRGLALMGHCLSEGSRPLPTGYRSRVLCRERS